MRFVVAAAMATVLTGGIADAQYKKTAPVPTSPGSVKITPGTPGATSTAAIVDELSKARRIQRAEAMRLVKQGKAVYVDVRSKDSYNQGHLPGAISVPLSEMMGRLKDLPPKKLIITYCA